MKFKQIEIRFQVNTTQINIKRRTKTQNFIKSNEIIKTSEWNQ